MDIYVGNIPKGTRPGELKKLLKDSVRERVFKRLFDQALALGRFDNDVDIKVIKRKCVDKRGYYRFGQISIPSDRIAPVALESLKNSEIRGAKLEVRAFVKRKPENDRRVANWRERPWKGKSRRISERRKKL
ncbi:MAG: hypothetical protein L0Z73_17740 [Gammaproteobacteria bacterium]|nr:hypothetical protein [Gammaproteobacteria bacterium]